jgi:hypothetical protein
MEVDPTEVRTAEGEKASEKDPSDPSIRMADLVIGCK